MTYKLAEVYESSDWGKFVQFLCGLQLCVRGAEAKITETVNPDGSSHWRAEIWEPKNYD